MPKKRIWLFSDSHGKHEELGVPENIDIAICAGDMGTYKNPFECRADLDRSLLWYNELPIEHKLYIPGNHDTALEADLVYPIKYLNIEVLIHQAIEIEGIKIFGSPYTPAFYNWAYNSTEEELKKLWEDIPSDTDILVTHGPPKNILDRCQDGYRAGCQHLMDRINIVKPKIHVFGHIHEDGGKEEIYPDTIFYNASVLDLQYQHHNNGHIIEF